MAYCKEPLFNGVFTKLWAGLRETLRDAEAPQGYQQLNLENPGFSVSETQGGDVKQQVGRNNWPKLSFSLSL